MIYLLKIGLVGLGFIGKQHLAAWNQIDEAEVVAICSRTGRDNSEIPSSFTGLIYTSLEDMVKDLSIDVIDICTPTYLHEEHVILAAKHKKHIICEKPLTLSYASAKNIEKVVQQNGVQLFVSHVLRFWPAYLTVKEQINEAGGSIELIHAKRLGQSPDWAEWFQTLEKSGGTLYDLHIHDIDYLLWVFGKVNSVYAVGFMNDSGAWNYVCTTLVFVSGQKAIVEASHRLPAGMPFTMGITAQSQTTYIDYHFQSDGNIETREDEPAVVNMKNDKIDTRLQVQDEDPFIKQLHYFTNVLQTGDENTVIPLADVLYTLEVLEAIERSLVTGEVIQLL